MTCCKKHLPVLLLTGLMTVMMIGCGSAPDATMTGGDSQESAAADFSLPDLQGKMHRLSDYRGKVVVLNFWDTWCGPCRQEIPGFIALQDKYGPEGLQLLGVALGQEGSGKVKQYSAQARINYPVLLLGNNADLISDYGGIKSIPTSFLIDREGNIADRHVGYLSRSAFENWLTPLLKGGKVNR